jgi:hypothetical protein
MKQSSALSLSVSQWSMMRVRSAMGLNRKTQLCADVS